MRNAKKRLSAALILLLLLSATSARAEGRQESNEYAARPGADEKPWMGITIQDISKEKNEYIGVEGIKGVFVSNVSMGSPADDAGILMGDVIVKLNGEDVDGVDKFISSIEDLQAGDRVVLEVNRAGKILDSEVILGGMPPVASEYGQTLKYGYDECDPEKICRQAGYVLPEESLKNVMGAGKYGRLLFLALRNLDLSDEQMKKANSIYSDHQKKAIRYAADIRIAEVELDDLMSGDSVNMDKVRAKINEISSRNADLRFSDIKSFVEFRGLLSQEQRKKLHDMESAGMIPGATGQY